MILTANIGKKRKHYDKSHARLSFWKAESKALRKKHRSLLNGAAALTVIILTAHILICAEIYRLLRFIGALEQFRLLFIGAAIVIGFIVFSLLNIGGRHLALSLYRKERTPNPQKITVGELFYSFGSKKRRYKSTKILYSDFKKAIFTSILLLIPLLFFVSLGFHKISIAVAVFCTIFIIFPSQKSSIEWIFELKHRKGSLSAEPNRMSSYAVIGREKELRKMQNKARLRFILGCTIPFGLAFIYFPYAWTADAVRAECVSSELISPSTQK